MEQQSGQFVDRGYISYHGTMSLDELMMEDLPQMDFQMRTRLRLFTEWGIGFEEPYTVPEKSNRSVAYANRDELIQSIELYTQKLRDDDHAEVSDEAPQGGMELTQSVVDEKKEKKAGHKSAYKSPYNTGGVK